MAFYWSVVAAGWKALRTRPALGRWVLLFCLVQAVVGLSEVTLFYGWMVTLALMRSVLAREEQAATRSRDEAGVPALARNGM
jgi:heme A synthase